ncbi:MAG: GNAT family N-acetyltransferase [Alistipes sp.]|nr:GNAT family N-acetyltransferase [Alistipes sp.]
MKPIIEPIPREDLLRELTPDHKIRETKKASNEIYVFSASECPALMLEVGRLREEAFRAAGGGTGEEVDIDDEDRDEEGYKQLIVWDPAAQEIVGGYRFIVCSSSNPHCLSTEHYFRFSKRFRRRFLPRTIELGRSFVQPAYQARRNPKSLYALDNLWDGLGALIVLNPRVKYLFGKVTMYTSFNREARTLLFRFLKHYFGDRDQLMEGIHPLPSVEVAETDEVFTGKSYEEDYRILVQHLREKGEGIPPLINAYMNLSPTMRLFDTVINPDFGNVEETGILITLKDIYPEKKLRYIRWEGWRRQLAARREAFLKRWVRNNQE